MEYSAGNYARPSQTLQPYMKSTQVFACPSNPRNKDTDWGATGSFVAIPNSYGYNYTPCFDAAQIPSGCGTGVIGSEASPRSIVQVPSVATTIIVGEANANNNDLRFRTNFIYSTACAGDGPFPGENGGKKFGGHLGTLNYLFVDGHVKALKPSATGTPSNMWSTEEDGAISTEAQNYLNCATAEIS